MSERRRSTEERRRRQRRHPEEADYTDYDNEDYPKNEEKRTSVFRFYFINIFLLVIILGIITFAGIVSMCEIKNVVCSGSDIYTDAELENYYLSGKYSKNTIYVYFKNLFRPTKVTDVPFVEDYSIRIKDKNTISIEVKEKQILGYIDMGDGRRAYFDKEGRVQEISDIEVDGVTKVSGLKVDNPKKGEILPIGSANVKTIIQVLSGIKENGLKKVTEMQFSNEGTIYLLCGDITINLGTRALLDEKLKRVKHILKRPELKGKKGTLHLEEWTEENTYVVFTEDSNS